MPIVTVSAGNGTTVSVPIGSLQNAQIAAQALAGVSAGVDNGTITPYNYNFTGPLVPPPGPSVLFLTGKGSLAIPDTTGTVVDSSVTQDTLLGGNAAEQLVVSGKGGITYFANTGAGTVIAGGGNNTIYDAPSGGGDHLILTDKGDDLIFALTGNDTVSAGKGHNRIVLGSGADSVQVTGADTIVRGTGASTITVITGNAVVYGGSGSLFFTNANNPSTVSGGTGSATMSGGVGGGEFRGGAGGKNFIVGGDQSSTLFGGGSGDQLFSVGQGNDLVAAGSGNETLTGVGSGADTFQAGPGNDIITGGVGNNTIVAGSGSDTLTGGPINSNDYLFIDGQAGGKVLITDFMKGVDDLTLQGYGPGALDNALDNATVVGGSTIIELPDNTRITFLGVTGLGNLGGGGGQNNECDGSGSDRDGIHHHNPESDWH